MFKTLQSEADLGIFAEETEKRLKIRYPMEYLRRSKVRVLVSSEGKFCGGYIFALKGPFRVIQSLPDDLNNPLLSEASLSEGFEITGLWLSEDVCSRRNNFRFWTQLYIDIITSKKKYFYYAYALEKKCLGRLYALINPTMLYQGETKILPGMRHAEKESIEVGSVNYVRWAVFHRGDFLIKKLVFSRALSNRYYLSMIPAIKQKWNRLKLKRKGEVEI